MPRNITFLFTDLVGSTAAASRVGPERAEQLRVEHFRLLRAAIRPHLGREVKNLGDGMMIMFSGAAAAIAAAATLQQAFDARNRHATDGERFDLRVGISAGDAFEEAGDFFGPPVVEAARLCATAEGGQILVSAGALTLLDTRDGVDAKALGPRELKGLPEPVEVVEIAWAPLPETSEPASGVASLHVDSDLRVPLPLRLSAAPGAVFAGRFVVRASWLDSWKAASAGEQRLWLLGGEAGIGKTTLVSRFAETAYKSGGVALYGRCDEDLGVPYQPWIEALSALVANAPEDLIAAHVDARGGELARLVPGLTERADVTLSISSDPVAERYALFGAVTDLLQRAAALRPILLVLDDLHWADKPTVQLLRHVASASPGTRLMVVANYRPTDISASHPLAECFGTLHRLDGVEFVDLTGLDDTELLDLMEATAGHELDADGLALRDAIAAETDGNAFFALEILRHLAETGAIANRGGRWVATADLASQGLPVSIRHVVSERVLRLGAEAHRILMTAAVIGREFDVDLLVEVADADEAQVLEIVDAAFGASLLRDVGRDRYTFAHALVEHALCEELTPSRIGRVHRRIAIALEDRCGADPGERIGELAYHWASAVVPEDLSKAITYARQAGDRALLQLAPDEALRWYTQALELHERHRGDEHLHVELLIGLGTAQRQTGAPGHRETLLAAADESRSLGDTDSLVGAIFANHRGFASVTGGIDTERLAQIEAALDAVGTGDSLQRARLLAILAAELTYGDDPSRRIDAASEAVEIGRRLDDPQTLLATLLGMTTSFPDVGAAPCEEAVALAQRLEDHVALVSASATLVTEALGLGDRATFDRAIEICTTTSARIGQPTLLWRSGIGVVMRAIVDGDLDRADELTEQHLALGTESGQPDTLLLYGALLATIRYHQGRFAEIVELIELAQTENPGVAMIRAGLIAMLIEKGDVEEARTMFDDEARAGFAVNDDVLRLTYLCFMAHSCARLDEVTHADTLLALLEPRANQIETAAATAFFSTSACAGTLAAMLGRDEEADHYFADAIRLAAGFGFPFLVAAAQREWAGALLARTAPMFDRARALLEEALSTARHYGFSRIERDAERLFDVGPSISQHLLPGMNAEPPLDSSSSLQRRGIDLPR